MCNDDWRGKIPTLGYLNASETELAPPQCDREMNMTQSRISHGLNADTDYDSLLVDSMIRQHINPDFVHSMKRHEPLQEICDKLQYLFKLDGLKVSEAMRTTERFGADWVNGESVYEEREKDRPVLVLLKLEVSAPTEVSGAWTQFVGPVFFALERRESPKLGHTDSSVDAVRLHTVAGNANDLATVVPFLNESFPYRQAPVKAESEIKLITKGSGGNLKLTPYKIKNVELDVSLNYNADFEPHHKCITSALSELKSGLVVLHGTPGSGKSSYIGWLVRQFKAERSFVYIPQHMAESLSDPGLLDLLLENAGEDDAPPLVLVIEDAERALVADAGGRSSATSTLLNISDGLLGSALKCMVIATTNQSLDALDPALVRAGRLISHYKFDKLQPDQANKLAEHLGRQGGFTSAKTLAEIYNDPVSTLNKTRKIGF